MFTEKLLANYPIISEQINKEELRVILAELEKTLKVDGAVVEFGCYIGTTSLFIRRLLDAHEANREFHVYDSFEGLPPKKVQDESPVGVEFKMGELAISKKQLLREFQKAHLQPPIIHKGWFNQVTAEEVPPMIAFAFLDGDFYESIRDSLGLVLPRMSRGGIIVIDDYIRAALPGVLRAVKELLPDKNIQSIASLGIIRL